jgi:hypothetical protein
MALPKPCLDCGTPTRNGSRCPACERAHDQARGTREQRGYGKAHIAERERQLAQWSPGQPCAIGREPVWDKSLLDLAHNESRTGYLGLACQLHNRGHHGHA